MLRFIIVMIFVGICFNWYATKGAEDEIAQKAFEKQDLVEKKELAKQYFKLEDKLIHKKNLTKKEALANAQIQKQIDYIKSDLKCDWDKWEKELQQEYAPPKRSDLAEWCKNNWSGGNYYEKPSTAETWDELFFSYMDSWNYGASVLCLLLKKIFWNWGLYFWYNWHPIFGLIYFGIVWWAPVNAIRVIAYGSVEEYQMRQESKWEKTKADIDSTNQWLMQHNTNQTLKEISKKIDKVY